MNHFEKLKENDVVVFKKNISIGFNWDIDQGDVGLVIEEGERRRMGDTDSYLIELEGHSEYFFDYEIEKIGEL